MKKYSRKQSKKELQQGFNNAVKEINKLIEQNRELKVLNFGEELQPPWKLMEVQTKELKTKLQKKYVFEKDKHKWER